jgi:hypothetical protein
MQVIPIDEASVQGVYFNSVKPSSDLAVFSAR